MLGIQLIGIIFGIFMISLTFLNYKQNKFSSKEWIVWCFLWITFFIIILFPGILNPILEILNLYRAMDLYISIGFLFFVIIIFYTYSLVRSLQHKVEILTREIAYLTIKKNKKKKWVFICSLLIVLPCPLPSSSFLSCHWWSASAAPISDNPCAGHRSSWLPHSLTYPFLHTVVQVR